MSRHGTNAPVHCQSSHRAYWATCYRSNLVVGIQHRRAFYLLFKTLQQDGNATIFDANDASKGGGISPTTLIR